MNWMEKALEIQESIRADRRKIHENAEVGFDLPKTTAYVKGRLREMGYEPWDCGRAGIIATVGKPGGKVFLLRADMDALPIREEAAVDFACPDSRMHACGHDLHTAMLLGAAKLLKDQEEQLPGMVKLMFQPSEETFEGCRDMLEHGLLEDPKPQGAMMIHVAAAMPMAPGTIVVSGPGVSAPAADYFTVTVHGKGCHGAAPQQGIDPIAAGAKILLALEELPAREFPGSVLTVGSFHAGDAGNVIPDKAQLCGSLRTWDESLRESCKARMVTLAEGTASACRARAEVSFGTGCPSLYNDPTLCAQVTRWLRAQLGEDKVFTAAQLGGTGGGGSEDFAYLSREVPSVMLALAAGRPEDGYAYPQHHPKAAFDESVLCVGAAALAACAEGFLKE